MPEGPSNGRLLKKNEFRFRVDKESLSKLEVRGRDYLLFQVIAGHGFTNFTRLHIKRVYGPELDSLK